jgi:hypothetical protein
VGPASSEPEAVRTKTMMMMRKQTKMTKLPRLKKTTLML